MTPTPLQALTRSLQYSKIVQYIERFAAQFPDEHLKDVVVDHMSSDRSMVIGGKRVVNFGCDGFLGLDRHPAVIDSLERGLRDWGAHNGASRAFSSVRANVEAEAKLAAWLGVEAVLIYPSVSLVNLGALPALLEHPDVLILDEHAHHSIHQGASIAQANGVRIMRFSAQDPDTLHRALAAAHSFRNAIVALDGVHSMTGEIAPLGALNEVALHHGAVLYVDDAHGTGVVGSAGRGCVPDALGSYANTFVVGSLSKAFSCMGGFVGCSEAMKRVLKIRSSTFLFGGPVPPPYLAAICAVCDILRTPEYGMLLHALRSNVLRFRNGAAQLGLTLRGGDTPIQSILIGDEERALQAGKLLFDRGFYVQSVTYPAVPFRAAVLRVQINANHRTAQIDGLLEALSGIPMNLEVASAT